MRFEIGDQVYDNRDNSVAVVKHGPYEILGSLVYWLELPNGDLALVNEWEVEPLLIVPTEVSAAEEAQCR